MYSISYKEYESLPGEVNSIQHYVIKFASDLRQVDGFLRVLQFPLPITDYHDMTEILLFLQRCVVNFVSFNITKLWVHTINLTPLRFIEVPVPSQESERSFICLYYGYRFGLFLRLFLIQFWFCSDHVVFSIFFHFNSRYNLITNTLLVARYNNLPDNVHANGRKYLSLYTI